MRTEEERERVGEGSGGGGDLGSGGSTKYLVDPPQRHTGTSATRREAYRDGAVAAADYV